MQRLGFLVTLVHGRVPLHDKAFGEVLYVGNQRTRFRILRSIRQGCSLVPLSSIMFTEVIPMLLTWQHAQLKGSILSLSQHELIALHLQLLEFKEFGGFSINPLEWVHRGKENRYLKSQHWID